jgi:hypothetical protein
MGSSSIGLFQNVGILDRLTIKPQGQVFIPGMQIMYDMALIIITYDAF